CTREHHRPLAEPDHLPNRENPLNPVHPTRRTLRGPPALGLNPPGVAGRPPTDPVPARLRLRVWALVPRRSYDDRLAPRLGHRASVAAASLAGCPRRREEESGRGGQEGAQEEFCA